MKLIWQDYLIIAAFFFQQIAHFSTLFLITNIASYSHVNVTTATAAVEANPLQKNIAISYYLDFIIQFLLYGLLIAMYLELRKKAIKANEYLIMNIMVLTIFVFAIGDSVNDLAYVAAFVFKV